MDTTGSVCATEGQHHTRFGVYDRDMSGHVVTAAELEQMSPAERHAVFEASIVTDLHDAPQGLVERARARAEQHIAESNSQLG